MVSHTVPDCVTLPSDLLPHSLPFLLDAVNEVLQDPKVRSDKRLGHQCNHEGTCAHYSADFIHSVAIMAVEKSANTFSNVLKRGAHHAPMDSSTEGFIRRQIFIESVITSIAKLSVPEERIFHANPNVFGDSVFEPFEMTQFIANGSVSIFCTESPYIREFDRMDAMGKFNEGFFWTAIDQIKEYPYLSVLLKRVAFIPFTFNRFKPELKANQITRFLFTRNTPLFTKSNIFACIVEFGSRTEIKIFDLNRFNDINVSSNFQIIAYITMER